MTSNWKECKLGDLCKIKGGKRLPAGKNLTTKPNTHPYIRVRDLTNIKTLNLTPDFEYVDDEVQKTIDRYIVNTGDVIISIVGTIGLISIIGPTLDNANLTENCAKLIDLKGIDNHFLYYYLISNEGQQEINRNSVGAVQAKLPLYGIGDIRIILPPLEIQRKIAKVLSAIDDKIELNNSINNNLEQQAQAIFKSWFIDFEPFGGIIPDDWQCIQLDEVADFIGGYSYKGNELQPSKYAMATIKNFERKGGFKLDGYKEIIPSDKCKIEQEAKLYDILVAHTDLTQNADVIGNAELLLCTDKYEKIVFSMDVVKVVPKNNMPHFILATMLKSKEFKSHCLGYVNGTTVLHLSKKALPDYIINIPNDLAILSELEQTLKNIYTLISNNLNENIKLTQFRDTLLPKLMSGEIDVDKVKL